MNDRYFDRTVEKADYLDDYDRTLDEIRRLASDSERLVRVFFSKRDAKDENYEYIKRFDGVDDLRKNFDRDDYYKVNNIDVLLIRKDGTAKTIKLDRQKKTVMVISEKSTSNY